MTDSGLPSSRKRQTRWDDAIQARCDNFCRAGVPACPHPRAPLDCPDINAKLLHTAELEGDTHHDEVDAVTGGHSGNYFSRRWHGRVPLPQLLWRDIIGMGTLVNLIATMLALAAITQDAPSGLAVALHFAPLPYNLFLFGALWRTPGRNDFAVGLVVVWLLLMTLI